MENVPKDRYCSPSVDLESASAFYVELEPMAGMRTQFMFWRQDKPPSELRIDKPRIRDLRPGDELVFMGFKRIVRAVKIYR